MGAAIEEFKIVGKPYFSQSELDVCVGEILNLAPQPVAEFSQLMQQADNLRLEYAAIVTHGIVDLTLTKYGVDVVVVPLSAISQVHYRGIKGTPVAPGRLDVTVVANAAIPPLTGYAPTPLPYLRYSATQADAIGRLRLFCTTLQAIVVTGKR